MKPTLIKAGQLAKCLLSRGLFDLFYNPKRAAGYWSQIARAALYDEKGIPTIENLSDLPSCNIDQIIPAAESVPVSLIDYDYSYGEMPMRELLTICRLVRYRKPKVIFEFGTYLGGTTLQLAANSDAIIYTLDLPPASQKTVLDSELDVYPDKPGIRFRNKLSDRIHQLLGNSQSFDFTSYTSKVDLILVDGSHHYDFVVHDSQNAIKMKSKNGIILWHDYAPYAPGVIQALHEIKITPLVHITGTSFVLHY